MKKFYVLMAAIILMAVMVLPFAGQAAAQSSQPNRAEDIYEDYWGRGNDTYQHGLALQKQADELMKRGKQMCDEGQKMMDKAQDMKKK